MEKISKEVLIKQNLLTEEEIAQIDFYNKVSIASNEEGNYDLAFKYAIDLLTLIKKAFPADSLYVAEVYKDLGEILFNKKDYDSAQRCFELIALIYEKEGEKALIDLAEAYHSLAKIYIEKNLKQQAFEYLQKAQAIYEKKNKRKSIELATIYYTLGLICNDLTKNKDALIYYQKAFNIYEPILGKKSSEIAIIYNDMGMVYSRLGDYSKALDFHFNSYKIHQKLAEKNAFQLAINNYSIAYCYYYSNKNKEALPYIEKAVEILLNNEEEDISNHLDFIKLKELIIDNINES